MERISQLFHRFGASREVSFLRKLIMFFPKVPRKRYNIFTGTNTFREWCQMMRDLLSRSAHEDASIISQYEEQFAISCSAKHAISFGAGRMALFAILEALGIGEGDEVIIPAFTCVVVPNAILYRGGRPIYVDIESHKFNIDVAKVEAAITPRTKALYAQHTFGVPCDVEGLRDIGRRYGFPVIEDAAHALGAKYFGKQVGSLTEVSFFSTDHSKVINTHLGGIAVTNNDVLAERLRKIQSRTMFLDKKKVHCLIRSFLIEYVLFSPCLLWLGRSISAVLVRLGVLFYFLDELETRMPTIYPYPCRMSSAQARLGLSQLQGLQGNLDHRRRISTYLEKKIKWYGMDSPEINESAWLRYSFLVENRAKFELEFGKYFDLGIWFTSVVAGRARDLQLVGYKVGSCPVAEYVSQHIVNIPTHLRVSEEVVQNELARNWGWLEKSVHFQLNGVGV